MKIIKQNPYRTLGIFSNASEKELQKQIATITRYAEVGKSKTFDTDFGFLGVAQRDPHLVNDATGHIEQAKNKVHHALFWFINNGHIDEVAFNHLKVGDIEKAVRIWKKTTGKEVTATNYSAFSNIGTLKLVQAFSEGSINTSALSEGIKFKVKLIDSKCFSFFIKGVADKTYSESGFDQVKLFIDEVWDQVATCLDEINEIKLAEVVKIVSVSDKRIHKYLTQKLVGDPLHRVESKIETSRIELKEDPDGGNTLGIKLFEESKTDIQKIKSILGEKNMQYILIADKLANQIIQCAVVYFNNNRKSCSTEVGHSALELLKLSDVLAIGEETKNRYQENSDIIADWIKEQPDPENIKNVKENISVVKGETDKLDNFTGDPEEILTLLDRISDEIEVINKGLINRDPLFVLNLSSQVVRTTANLLVEILNRLQNEYVIADERNLQFRSGMSGNSHGYTELIKLKTTLNLSKLVINKLKKFKMNEEDAKYFRTTASDILSLRTSTYQLLGEDVPTEGCYIATMAYGDYEHPQVMKLRVFRDDILSNSMPGRLFIDCYYAISPRLTVLLKNKSGINSGIRFLLNQLIKHLP